MEEVFVKVIVLIEVMRMLLLTEELPSTNFVRSYVLILTPCSLGTPSLLKLGVPKGLGLFGICTF